MRLRGYLTTKVNIDEKSAIASRAKGSGFDSRQERSVS